jgi:hypothetical protein
MDSDTGLDHPATGASNGAAAGDELAAVRSLLDEIKSGVQAVKDSADGWKQR